MALAVSAIMGVRCELGIQPEFPHDADSAHAGHVEIEDDQIGMQFPRPLAALRLPSAASKTSYPHFSKTVRTSSRLVALSSATRTFFIWLSTRARW